MLRLEEARRQSQTLALAAVISGAEFVDPVAALYAELDEDPSAVVSRPDYALRVALGLPT